ncbi:MAG: ParB N-terminal domain-containing protein [Myxococcales bacterium]|nr:ParB N-terminal domain-containing protein [Myxococcales bacterium]
MDDGDPIRFGGGWNLYGYSDNDPINYIDVDGKNPVAIVVAVGLVIGMGMSLSSDSDVSTLDVLGAMGNVLGLRGLGAGASAARAGAGGVGTPLGMQELGGVCGAGGGGKASPFSFHRLHGLSGGASSRNVAKIERSMNASGWNGPPIKVFEHNGTKYVLDGHHRLAAARQARLPEVPYESIPVSELGSFGYASADDVLMAASEAFGR